MKHFAYARNILICSLFHDLNVLRGPDGPAAVTAA